ncbi:serine hydrolase domain-containing protein [Streptomyces sp. NPDC001985]|uniref:serine hydrolase domain-containing protein n=1 Tax=Streptomyces sp. NPDC001985 TaxID=3154406 RepID=UPI003319A935
MAGDRRTPSRRAARTASATRATRASAALAVLVALAALATTLAGAPAAASTPRPGDPVQRGMERLVTEDRWPGALAAVRGPGERRFRHLTAGVADLATGAPVPRDGRVRIGSNSKTYLAVVVLQLVGEGRVELDGPVETHLPGLVRGEGIDGRNITVRQLLQHTSGLPNYTDHLEPDWFVSRDRYLEPRELVDLALSRKASFPPGTDWQYSNTNFVLAGLLVQKVTGRPLAEEIERRVLAPLGLRDTSFPAAGDRTIPGPHPRGYHADDPAQTPGDITVMDPSWAWGAGSMIATPGDLNRFLTALMGGRLLKPALLEQMRTTVPADRLWPGWRYGLGLLSMPLSCGGVVWGHGGDIPGYKTISGVTDDGRAATLALTAIRRASHPSVAHANDVFDTALCG